jgi:hypothetical protein
VSPISECSACVALCAESLTSVIDAPAFSLEDWTSPRALLCDGEIARRCNAVDIAWWMHATHLVGVNR